MIQLVAQQTGGSIRQVCAVLEKARSSFYHAATPTVTQVADVHLGELIETVFRRHRRRYGDRHLSVELSDRGLTCAPARIRRLMAQRGLRAIQPKNFLPKTSDGHVARAVLLRERDPHGTSPLRGPGFTRPSMQEPIHTVPDVKLAGESMRTVAIGSYSFSRRCGDWPGAARERYETPEPTNPHQSPLRPALPEAPDLAWAGDITFIPTSAGWLYLAVVIDLCSRRIVGWSLADHLRSDLVLDAFHQALRTRPTLEFTERSLAVA